MSIEVYTHPKPFSLESGESLPGFQLAYQTWGKRKEDDSNIIWVCHALTGNTDVVDWWPGMIGENAVFDPENDFIICANMLGSCYGSTDALSTNPETRMPYFHDFPLLTNRDIVLAFDALREALQIKKIKVLIGGSTGGQHVLEWAIMQPDLFEYIIPIAANAQHSAWGIAFNETQRMAIAADSSWETASPNAGLEGMKAARAAALLSYRSYEAYELSQTETNDETFDDFRASSYQRYQGQKLADRFHAFAYWTLSKAMDSQNVGRGRGGVANALGQIKAKALVIAINSDILFPPFEQRLIAEHIPDAQYVGVDSTKGHDGFLIEIPEIAAHIQNFLE